MQSYAGKYVPAISFYIHKNNPTAKVKINLVGMAIGDGLCDPEMVCIWTTSSSTNLTLNKYNWLVITREVVHNSLALFVHMFRLW